MESLLKDALQGAQADYVEIRIEETETNIVSFSDDRPDDIGSRLERGGIIRACTRGGWSRTTFNDPSKLKERVAHTCALSQKIGTGKTQLYDIPVITDTTKTSYTIDPRTIPLAEKEALCRKYNDRIRTADGIQTSRTVYRDYTKHVWFANAAGTYIDQTRTHCGAAVMAFAKDGANVQRSMKSWGDHHGWENMKPFEEKTEAVIKTVRDLLSAPKVTGGQYTVILDPAMTGLFTHEAFGHLSEADFLYENEELKARFTPGRRFGKEILNIVDQGNIPGSGGYIAYDDEGVESRKNYLIKNGVLASRLHNRETAGIMQEAVTGNARALNYTFAPIVRMTNTFIEPGKSTQAEMLDGITNGLYVVGALAGMTDLEKFSFVAERAYEIKNGKIGNLVRDTILSGNLFQTLANIDMIGNDFELFGGLGGCGKDGQSPLPVGDGGPHIRIQNVLIGGN